MADDNPKPRSSLDRLIDEIQSGRQPQKKQPWQQQAAIPQPRAKTTEDYAREVIAGFEYAKPIFKNDDESLAFEIKSTAILPDRKTADSVMHMLLGKVMAEVARAKGIAPNQLDMHGITVPTQAGFQVGFTSDEKHLLERINWTAIQSKIDSPSTGRRRP